MKKASYFLLLFLIAFAAKAQEKIGFTQHLVENVLINQKDMAGFNAKMMDERGLKQLTDDLLALKKDDINAASLGSFFSRHQENQNNLKGLLPKFTKAVLINTQKVPFDLKNYTVTLFEFHLLTEKNDKQRFFIYEIEDSQARKSILTYVFYNEK